MASNRCPYSTCWLVGQMPEKPGAHPPPPLPRKPSSGLTTKENSAPVIPGHTSPCSCLLLLSFPMLPSVPASACKLLYTHKARVHNAGPQGLFLGKDPTRPGLPTEGTRSLGDWKPGYSLTYSCGRTHQQPSQREAWCCTRPNILFPIATSKRLLGNLQALDKSKLSSASSM